MIDLKELQRDFDGFSLKLSKRGVQKSLLEKLNELNNSLKSKKLELEEQRAKQNSDSKLFPQYLKEGRDIAELKEALAKNKELIAISSESVKEIERELESLALNIPNVVDVDTPEGESEEDNVELKKVLTPREFDFKPREHFDLNIDNWIDFERGVKLAKSRFSVFKNQGARVYRALVNYMLDFNRARGFQEVTLPYIANEQTLFGTGQLPKFADDLYKLEGENLYLIPTSEVQLVNLYRDEILDLSELPIKLTSYTECFRKEAGSAGRDTRGIIRQHQFGKVELVSITTEDESDRVFEEMLSVASDMLTSLNLPHRLVRLCSGDLGFGASKTIDLEVWLPGQNRYREISSVSNTRDFQARRAKIRYKDGKKSKLVHTLNGSSLAIGRTLIAIMENYQKSNGEVDIPDVLREYLK